jgi:hypothetical protein
VLAEKRRVISPLPRAGATKSQLDPPERQPKGPATTFWSTDQLSVWLASSSIANTSLLSTVAGEARPVVNRTASPTITSVLTTNSYSLGGVRVEHPQPLDPTPVGRECKSVSDSRSSSGRVHCDYAAAVIFRRSRFDELVDRQLDFFTEDEAELLVEAEEADEAQTRAGRDEAEELYGDYQLVVDEIAERLLDVRETYAATLSDDVVDDYRAAFTRAATKRFRAYADLLADVEPD